MLWFPAEAVIGDPGVCVDRGNGVGGASRPGRRVRGRMMVHRRVPRVGRSPRSTSFALSPSTRRPRMVMVSPILGGRHNVRSGRRKPPSWHGYGPGTRNSNPSCLRPGPPWTSWEKHTRSWHSSPRARTSRKRRGRRRRDEHRVRPIADSAGVDRGGVRVDRPVTGHPLPPRRPGRGGAGTAARAVASAGKGANLKAEPAPASVTLSSAREPPGPIQLATIIRRSPRNAQPRCIPSRNSPSSAGRSNTCAFCW